MKHLSALAVATFAFVASAQTSSQPPAAKPNSNPVAHDEGGIPPPVKEPAPTTVQGDTQPTVVQSGEQKTSEIIHNVEDAKVDPRHQGAGAEHRAGQAR